MSTFYNPYNFIPAFPRDAKATAEGLRTGRPAGHDRWHRQLWSGRIAVTITTITPLLLAAASEHGEGPDHRTIAVPTVAGDDGVDRVDLAPTQLKGMLRAAFEAVTNSRFGVVSAKHHQPLGYRSDAASGSGLRPVIVEQLDGRPRVTILGDLKPGTGPAPVPAAVLAGWLHPADGSRPRDALLEHLHHRQHVEAMLVADTITTPKGQQLSRWRVTDAVPAGAILPDRAPDARPWARVQGHLHLTGPTIAGKRWERLFVTTLLAGSPGVMLDEHRRLSVSESQELLGRLRQLITHQRAIHTDAGGDGIWQREHPAGTHRMPWEYLGHEPGSTAWSRHLYDITNPDRPPGAPAPGWTGPDASPGPVPPPAVYTCWAETKADRLRPVMVSRLLYDRSPVDLLHESLRPARTLDDLSPADRVFGWVAPRNSRRDARRAHRGQVRVVKVSAPAVDGAVTTHPEGSKILPALSSPKPSQGRFYLGWEGRNGPEGLKGTRATFFGPKQTLRGRKVYLYRRGERGDQVTPSGVRYDDEPTTQNSTLRSWVNAGAEFGFELVVDNLTDLELGALLWLLDPERLGQDGNPGRHRLGMGKPYGFGVVELSLATEGTVLGRGDQIAQRLSTLDATPTDDPAWTGLAERFEQAVSGSLAPVLCAVRVAAAGVGARKQIQYPRNRREDDGYTWFVDEERAAGKGQAQALPLLEGPQEQGTLKPSEGMK